MYVIIKKSCMCITIEIMVISEITYVTYTKPFFFSRYIYQVTLHLPCATNVVNGISCNAKYKYILKKNI